MKEAAITTPRRVRPSGQKGQLLALLGLVQEKYISPDAYWALHRKHPKRLRVMTVNLEILKGLLDDPSMLEASDACTLDSAILETAMNRLFPGTFTRLTGSEIVRQSPQYIAHRAVMMFGASQEAREISHARYIAAGAAPEEVLIADEPTYIAQQDLDALPSQRVGFFAYGFPKQEDKITAFVARFPHDRSILIGVGGAIDYFADLMPTPPAWMQGLGLEWAWRLALQPRARTRRMLRIVPLGIRLRLIAAPGTLAQR